VKFGMSVAYGGSCAQKKHVNGPGATVTADPPGHPNTIQRTLVIFTVDPFAALEPTRVLHPYWTLPYTYEWDQAMASSPVNTEASAMTNMTRRTFNQLFRNETRKLDAVNS
jgi:hypothetical protein